MTLENRLSDFIEKVESKKAIIGIVGLGYVGLPLAIAFADKGFKVRGLDIDSSKPTQLLEGKSYLKHIVPERFVGHIASGLFYPTTDFTFLAECDAVIVCVPTPLTPQREPDTSYISNSMESVAKYLHVGQLVSLESSTYPGTTTELVLPILEKTGFKAGKDFFLVFSPEREDPGNAKFNTKNIPKIVGGHTSACQWAGVVLYRSAVDEVVPVSSTETAEMVKLLENIYRAVNIALVNELKMVCAKLNIDITEVIRAAATKPFGFQPFWPGPGWGGHCLAGNELVWVKDNIGQERICTMEGLFALSTQVEKVDSCNFAAKLPGFKIKSFDRAKEEPCWEDLLEVYHRIGPFPGRNITVQNEEEIDLTTTITVTDKHPMLRYSEASHEWRIALARDLLIDDLLPSLNATVLKKAPVIRIEKTMLDDAYSVEVARTSTFITTGGLAVHNCISVDPFYLTWKARQVDMPTRFIELAGEVNYEMPYYVVQRVQDVLNEHKKPLNGAKVLLLGVAYKPNIDDMRESPALKVLHILEAKGANVIYHDSFVPTLPNTRQFKNAGQKSVELTAELLAQVDCVVVTTDHTNVDYRFVAKNTAIVVDTRNCVPGGFKNVYRA